MQQMRTRLLPALAVLLALAACSDSAPTPNPTPSPAPTPAPTPTPAPAPSTSSGVVTRVIDGDTIVVESVGTVRLIGIDTPETVDPQSPVQCFGPEASAFTRETATGKRVRLDYDVDRTDRFGRTLAYVYLADDTFLNADIVRRGFGRAYTLFPFRYIDEFRAIEREAREARRGLWGACAGS
jgi:micrococcal nuclease